MDSTELLVTGRILSFDLGEKPFGGMALKDGKVAALSREPLPHSAISNRQGRQVGALGGSIPGLGFGDKYVVPAFVDSHVHLFELGLQFIFPSFNRADSLEAVFDALVAARSQSRQLGFLLGFNLDPDNLREQRMPTRQELDKVISDQPILVYRIDGHSASLNGRGFDLISKLPSDEGVELDEFRRLAGVVTVQAYEAASRAFKRLVPRDIKLLAFEQGAGDAVHKGVLTIGALCGSDEPGDDIPELLVGEKAKLPLHVEVFPQTRDISRARRMGLPRIGGCILIDGSFGSHSAALLDDYADQPGEKGRLYLSDAELEKFFTQADWAAMQVAVHAIGDRAVDQVVSCWESIISTNPKRHRIEHAELLSPSLIERIARLNIILGVQPAFEHYWGGSGGMYERRLGKRFLRTNPYRELLDHGVILAGGSDAPITMIDPRLGINAAAQHPVAEHRMMRLEACRMFTDRAAFSLGCEARKGSLAPGHDADFAVLSNNPLQDADFSVVRLFRQGQEVSLP